MHNGGDLCIHLSYRTRHPLMQSTALRSLNLRETNTEICTNHCNATHAVLRIAEQPWVGAQSNVHHK